MEKSLPSPKARWLWLVPLVAVLAPAWMAWKLTCPVPHADHWFAVADPYLNWQHGASFWGQVHAQGNDSRLDTMKLLGFVLIKLTKWDLRIESLTCVFIALLTALSTVWVLRRRLSGTGLWMAAVTVLSVGLILTPHQWMNWTFGVQTCYVMVVLFTVLVVVCFETDWPLWARVLAAGFFAFVAAHSFVNGWLAWGLGTICLGRALWLQRAPTRTSAMLVGLWMGLLIANILIYTSGYAASSSGVHEVPLMTRILAAPMSFVEFFVRVLSAPFSDFGLGLNRDERFVMNCRVAAAVSTVSLLLCGAMAILGGRRLWREKATEAWPFLLLTGYGLANAAAVTLARTGMIASGPFQSRYIAYTLWFHVGLLALLGLMEGRAWRLVRVTWLSFLFIAAGFGVVQGYHDGRRDFDRNQIMAAAGSMRHVAVEPAFLDAINPGAGARGIAELDELETLASLHIPTIRSENVKDATLAAPDSVKGELKSGELQSDGLYLRGWAMETTTRNMAAAVVISFQAEGQDEKWLGIAQRRLIESRLSQKHHARAEEDRLGWAYKPGFRAEKATMSESPNPFKAKPIPPGKVTFRAYAFDVGKGTFAPLTGSFTAEIK